MSASGVWFLVVGGSAALTHLGVFTLVHDAMPAEWANALGFVVAFGVSFVGHRRLSFRDTGTSIQTSLLRFVLTALAGFVCNEAVFVLLLRGLDWPALLALISAMLAAAGQTFVLSRYWAFRR